ncbi:MAG: low-specificity L-threonine aldolase [Thermoflavifilum sp.]|nr:low-specificity L-threonine aldolase [Thermoflavifilum sp.]
MIDFRSDTVTKPTPGMLDAMMKADVGDDVWGEDPTVRKLEEQVAGLLGKEAGLFCPSGTMTNQIAVKIHTQPGDEVICSELAHVYQYEAGGMAFHSGVQAHTLPGNRGMITAEQIREAIQPDDIHKPISRLVCIENTVNRGGGCCYHLEELQRIHALCRERGLALHLDGARLFHALIARGEQPEQYGVLFDTVSICLSKGLGCPVGSVLVGSRDLIQKARRVRKLMGGGMRQAGFLAAAGLYALEHHIHRLAEDHDHARQLAAALAEHPAVASLLPVETNILIFELKPPHTASSFAAFMRAHQILVHPIGPRSIRMVTHLDIHPPMVAHTLEVIRSFPEA